MELKVGKMTLRELSLWFGLKPDTISNCKKTTRERKFKILSNYCDYHFEGRSLFIDKIYYSVYTKAFEIIEEEFPRRWGIIKNKDNSLVNEKFTKMRIDTCSRVGCDIYFNVPEVKAQITLSTTKNYTNKVKLKQYGRTYKKDGGTKGRCEYVYLNEDETDLLTEEQMDIVKECANEVYGERISLQIAEIDEEFVNGNITKEERDKYIGEINTCNFYEEYKDLVIERLGFYPIKRTRLMDDF